MGRIYLLSSIACLNACANWSGHDVLRMPHRIPSSRFMTSSAFCPRTSDEIPCVLPLQPPIKATSLMMPLSFRSISIADEHVPDV